MQARAKLRRCLRRRPPPPSRSCSTHCGWPSTTSRTGDRAVADDLAALEGYRWLTITLQVALDCYLWADADRPEFVELTSPTRKWGGDNADAAYWFAPVDPRRRYRVTGRRVDAAYLSLTVYGGPDDGRWSTRIVATANDESLSFADDGTFELLLGPDLEPGPARCGSITTPWRS